MHEGEPTWTNDWSRAPHAPLRRRTANPNRTFNVGARNPSSARTRVCAFAVSALRRLSRLQSASATLRRGAQPTRCGGCTHRCVLPLARRAHAEVPGRSSVSNSAGPGSVLVPTFRCRALLPCRRSSARGLVSSTWSCSRPVEPFCGWQRPNRAARRFFYRPRWHDPRGPLRRARRRSMVGR